MYIILRQGLIRMIHCHLLQERHFYSGTFGIKSNQMIELLQALARLSYYLFDKKLFGYNLSKKIKYFSITDTQFIVGFDDVNSVLNITQYNHFGVSF